MDQPPTHRREEEGKWNRGGWRRRRTSQLMCTMLGHGGGGEEGEEAEGVTGRLTDTSRTSAGREGNTATLERKRRHHKASGEGAQTYII